MHSQVALLLQDAFLQAEDFSIPGIGSFFQKPLSAQPGVEIIFDLDADKAPSLATYWEKEMNISAAAAAQRLSELRVAMRWALKTNGHFLIPEVGALHQLKGGDLQFHALNLPQEEVEPAPVVPTPVAEPVAVVTSTSAPSRGFNNRMIGYMLIGAFGLIGLIILGQAIWGNDGTTTPKQQAALLEASAEETAPQLAKTTNYVPETSAKVDSPLKPVSKEQIVSTSRPQDKSNSSNANEASPAARITPRNATTASTSVPAATTRSNEDPNVVDIAVLDTFQNASNSATANARMASRGEVTSSSVPTTEARNQFHLIAGSFANYKAAQEFASEMREQGSQPIILPANEQSHMQYRVSIFHHADREQVSAHKQGLIRAGKKAGWIFAPAASTSSF
jgi:hypothetical protein